MSITKNNLQIGLEPVKSGFTVVDVSTETKSLWQMIHPD